MLLKQALLDGNSESDTEESVTAESRSRQDCPAASQAAVVVLVGSGDGARAARSACAFGAEGAGAEEATKVSRYVLAAEISCCVRMLLQPCSTAMRLATWKGCAMERIRGHGTTGHCAGGGGGG